MNYTSSISLVKNLWQTTEIYILKEPECVPRFLEPESIIIKGLPLIPQNELFIFILKINCSNKFLTDT